MWLMLLPPAVVKLPPTYKALLDTARASTSPFTPEPTDVQFASLKAVVAAGAIAPASQWREKMQIVRRGIPALAIAALAVSRLDSTSWMSSSMRKILILLMASRAF